jgi:hypothetical protein
MDLKEKVQSIKFEDNTVFVRVPDGMTTDEAVRYLEHGPEMEKLLLDIEAYLEEERIKLPDGMSIEKAARYLHNGKFYETCLKSKRQIT